MISPSPIPTAAQVEAALSSARTALAKAVKALRPIRSAVFNYNGDMTISVPYLDYDQCVSGYFAYGACEDALTGLATIPSPDADKAQTVELQDGLGKENLRSNSLLKRAINAEAEVERLRNSFAFSRLWAERNTAESERDAARAEVERLREALHPCPACDGKGGSIDTTYDRTGSWSGCNRCCGTGLVFKGPRTLAVIGSGKEDRS